MNTFKQVGHSKNLTSYFDQLTKTLYLERKNYKGMKEYGFKIEKSELYHLSRVLMRVQQNELHRKIKK